MATRRHLTRSAARSRLTPGDLCAALRFLAACDIEGGVDALAASVTKSLPALIAADVTVVGTVTGEGTLRAVEQPRVTGAADLETYMRLSRGASNPLLDHFAATGDVEARRMSDFLSGRLFRRHPLYVEFYRKFGLESVLGVVINRSAAAFAGVTLNRGRRDFDDRERAILTLLRPHLVNAYRTARAFDRLRADVAGALAAVDTSGFALVVVSEGGRVRLQSPRAAAWVRRYFGMRPGPARLPESLDRWVRHHVEAMRDVTRLPPLRMPLVTERDGSRLVVRLVTGIPDTLLLLEEHGPRIDEEARATLGLSPREAEIVGWVAQGKTTPEIGTILGVSSRTVQTYLQRVFGKLGVQTRAAAVARALAAGREGGHPADVGSVRGRVAHWPRPRPRSET